jgi:hypothetical protein
VHVEQTKPYFAPVTNYRQLPSARVLYIPEAFRESRAAENAALFSELPRVNFIGGLTCAQITAKLSAIRPSSIGI